MSDVLDSLVEIGGEWFLPAKGHHWSSWLYVDHFGNCIEMSAGVCVKPLFYYLRWCGETFVYAKTEEHHRSLQKCIAKMKLIYPDCNIKIIPYSPGMTNRETEDYVRTTPQGA